MHKVFFNILVTFNILYSSLTIGLVATISVFIIMDHIFHDSSTGFSFLYGFKTFMHKDSFNILFKTVQ